MGAAMNRMGRVSGAVLALALAAAGAFRCAGEPQAPARAVRLSSVDGQVEISQGNQVLAQQAPVNSPLFEGTEIRTSQDGRAEVQFEDGSVARLSPNSSITLTALRQQGGEGSGTETGITLNSGLAYFEMQGETDGAHLRVSFGASTVTAAGFTVLRVNFDSPPGELAVFSGSAHLEGANSLVLDVHDGQTAKLSAQGAGEYDLADAIDPDSWDEWNSDRDQALNAERAHRTAATNNMSDSNNPAWGDLDASGSWYNVPGQGYVWSPYEAENASWDPYGCGSWVSEPGYGYVWVSCESWGYMPYASGSWNYYDDFGWGWAPGFGGPWWGTGVWVLNIPHLPPHYILPRRPRVGGPVRGPIRPGGGRYQPFPVIAVNRPQGTPGETIRERNAPVSLAGNTVAPLRPLAPRATYAGAEGGLGGYTAGNMAPHSGYGASHPAAGYGSGYRGQGYGRMGTAGSQGTTAGSPGSYGYRPAPPPAYRPGAPPRSVYAPPPHAPAPPPPPRPASGGGAVHSGGARR